MCKLSDEVTLLSQKELYWNNNGAVRQAEELFRQRNAVSEEIGHYAELCSTLISASNCARAKIDIFSRHFFTYAYRAAKHYLEALYIALQTHRLAKRRGIDLTLCQIEILATVFMIAPMVHKRVPSLILQGMSRCDDKLPEGITRDSHKARLCITFAHYYELRGNTRVAKSYSRTSLELVERHVDTIDPKVLLRIYRRIGALRCRLERRHPIAGLMLLKKALVIAISLNLIDAATKIAYEIRKWEPDFRIR